MRHDIARGKFLGHPVHVSCKQAFTYSDSDCDYRTCTCWPPPDMLIANYCMFLYVLQSVRDNGVSTKTPSLILSLFAIHHIPLHDKSWNETRKAGQQQSSEGYRLYLILAIALSSYKLYLLLIDLQDIVFVDIVWHLASVLSLIVLASSVLLYEEISNPLQNSLR